MIKHILISSIFTAGLVFVGGHVANAKCAPDTDMKTYSEIVGALDMYRPGLRTARDTARKHAKNSNITKQQAHIYQRIDLISNRLEYWSKDTARYLRKYTESHPDAVCDRMEKDHVYMVDFLILGFFYKHSPTMAYHQMHDELYK